VYGSAHIVAFRAAPRFSAPAPALILRCPAGTIMAANTDIDAVLRIRRHQPTRLEGFVDASFAFAVTLLVISIGHTPATVADMLHALRGIPAFALCFLLLARLWNAHREWSRHYDIEDSISIVLSLTLVLVVLIFVYPLRLLFALLFAWMSAGYLVDQPVGMHNVEELRAAFEVYGVGFATISALFALLYAHAARRAQAIGLDSRERLATRMHIVMWMALSLTALISLVSATLLPFQADQPFVFTIPGALYATTSITAPAIRRHFRNRLAALAPGGT
jgi:uncharacterized membrane protein